MNKYYNEITFEIQYLRSEKLSFITNRLAH